MPGRPGGRTREVLDRRMDAVDPHAVGHVERAAPRSTALPAPGTCGYGQSGTSGANPIPQTHREPAERSQRASFSEVSTYRALPAQLPLARRRARGGSHADTLAHNRALVLVVPSASASTCGFAARRGSLGEHRSRAACEPLHAFTRSGRPRDLRPRARSREPGRVSVSAARSHSLGILCRRRP